MNEGKGLTEADQVWIEENAQQRLLAASAEADATHQAEGQQLQSDIEKVPFNAHHVSSSAGVSVSHAASLACPQIKEKTAALVTNKMAELDTRQTALVCGTSR